MQQMQQMMGICVPTTRLELPAPAQDESESEEDESSGEEDESSSDDE